MRKILVEPEQLESCAARMEEKNQDYERHTSELFNAVETMGTSWKGEDNAAFTSKIVSYESNFKTLHLLASEYADFLKESAKGYRQTQQEMVSMASSLWK